MTEVFTAQGRKENKQFVNRHFDKLILVRLILFLVLVLVAFVWIAMSGAADNQRAMTVLTRTSDMLMNVILTLVGALVTLLTGKFMESQRAGDKPSLVPPEEPAKP